jgi:cytochrome c peroxidase
VTTLAAAGLGVAFFLSVAVAARADPVAEAKRRPLGHDDVSYTFSAAPFVASFTPPAPGTYRLPPIDTVGDHPLVGADGRATTLFEVIGSRIAVVSFIYGSCAEATGCPMSTAVLHALNATLAKDAGDVALVTVSFDPERDTPARLAEMQATRVKGSTWRFVGGRDDASLAALLGDFGQTVSKLYWEDGTWTGVYRHVLKVYLLDRDRRVRNVYSTGFLSAELVRADIATLKMESVVRR